MYLYSMIGTKRTGAKMGMICARGLAAAHNENTPHSWEYSLWSCYPVLLGTKKSPNSHVTDEFRVSAALWKTDGRVWAAGANDETMYANTAQAN